ncbi:MAG: amidohydrolase [Pirellulales bacterium]
MTTPVHRRSFLQSTTLAGGALLAAGTRSLAFTAEDKQPMTELPIIDTHHHLWDLTKFKLPWLTGAGTEPLARSFVMKDYREAVASLNVVKTVYMEVDVDPAQQDAEADYVIDLCQQGDQLMAAAVISGRPSSDGFKAYIGKYKDNPYIKGVRQVLHVDGTPPGYCLGKGFIRGVQLLGEMGKSFDLCMRASDLPDAAKLIDLCPDTRFILDHCGNADVQSKDRTQWQKDMAAVAKRKNVIGKVSGIVASAKPGEWSADDLAPIVNHTLSVFGPDRVIFGGDWPVCTLAASYRQWVEALRSIVAERSEAERRKLFHDNAAKFYGLA